eukprot:TRINITY_DN6447_c0_g1_i1.p1 TRINITY_DN6447_c0_g1~~TRINITY_DN6447_c0_g1_i1.p1  ORF type:complete len:267 (+),score=97.78 TRINITY_DN6447_c0_g1_i1:45-803(+)
MCPYHIFLPESVKVEEEEFYLFALLDSFKEEIEYIRWLENKIRSCPASAVLDSLERETDKIRSSQTTLKESSFTLLRILNTDEMGENKALSEYLESVLLQVYRAINLSEWIEEKAVERSLGDSNSQVAAAPIQSQSHQDSHQESHLEFVREFQRGGLLQSPPLDLRNDLSGDFFQEIQPSDGYRPIQKGYIDSEEEDNEKINAALYENEDVVSDDEDMFVSRWKSVEAERKQKDAKDARIKHEKIEEDFFEL